MLSSSKYGCSSHDLARYERAYGRAEHGSLAIEGRLVALALFVFFLLFLASHAVGT